MFALPVELQVPQVTVSTAVRVRTASVSCYGGTDFESDTRAKLHGLIHGLHKPQAGRMNRRKKNMCLCLELRDSAVRTTVARIICTNLSIFW